MQKERAYKWDTIKFFLIFLVVFGHFIDGLLECSDTLKGTWLWLCSFHMPAFIFVSGLFSKSAINDVVKRKSKSLFFLKLYCIFKVAILIIAIIFNRKASFELLSERSAPWYLLAVTLLMWITAWVKDREPKNVMILALIIALVFGFDRKIGDFLAIRRVITYFPFFYAGYLLDPNDLLKQCKENKYLKSRLLKCVGVISLILAEILLIKYADEIYKPVRAISTGANAYPGYLNPEIGVGLRILNYVWAAYVIIVMIMIVPNRKNVFATWGTRTLSIYIIHTLVYRAMRYLDYEKWIRIKLPNSWIYIAVVIPVVVTVILCHRVFENAIMQFANSVWCKKKE